MRNDFVAKCSIQIQAPIAKVWDALVQPEAIRQYMFGTEVSSDWKEGRPITWRGEWKGKAYEDKGVIEALEPNRLLRYSHFSPLTGEADVPENYHHVSIELAAEGPVVLVTLTQDNNPTDKDRAHSEENWGMMLATLKQYLEK